MSEIFIHPLGGALGARGATLIYCEFLFIALQLPCELCNLVVQMRLVGFGNGEQFASLGILLVLNKI